MWSAWRWVTKTARTRGGRGPARVDGEPGPPQLTVHAFAAVDEVDGVADHHGVGEAAPADLGEPTATGTEEDHARPGVGAPRSATVDSRVREPTVASGNLTSCGELVICRRTPASGRGQRTTIEQGGFAVATTTDEVVFPKPDEIEGFWNLDKMHAPAADHPAVVRPRRAHPRQGIHPGPGRVRLPGHGDGEGDQPLLLRLLPPAPGRGRDRAADGALPREARQQGAHRRQVLGGGVEARGHRQEQPAEDGRLVGPVRRRARRQARRAHRVDDPSVVDPRARQLRPPLQQRVLRPLRQGDAAGGVDRGVPACSRASRRRRSTRPGACGR